MLLRDILDPHSFTIQIARLTRERNYDDELQSYDHPHPPNAPEWSYIEQIDQVYDTEIEGSKTPVYGDNEDSIVGNMPVYDDNEDSIMYNTDEEYAHGESSTTGMIRRAILEADSQQKDKNKKIEDNFS
ncbi:3796_t:CDS:2 [Rhizophagus irregularis]|nr:3796_t:CDS:2 [Rhizophagus irregularis]